MRIPCAIVTAVVLLSLCGCGPAGSAAPTVGGATRLLTPEGRSVDPAFFPIGVWLQDPALAPRYKEAGMNFYVGLHEGPTEAQLAELRRHGMPVMCEQNDVALRHLADPLIIGWECASEPDNAQSFQGYWRGDVEKIREGWPELYASHGLDKKPYTGKYGPPIPPQWVVRRYQEIKKNDPSRPARVGLNQSVAWETWTGRGWRTGKLEDYPAYIQGGDIICFDIYPACHTDPEIAGKLWYVARGVERLMTWTDGRKPLWIPLECTRIDNPDGKMATPEQVKAEAWMAITQGATGLIWFVHEFKPKFNGHALLDNPEMLAGVTAINKQIQALAPVLNSPTQEDLAHVTAANAEVPINLLAKRHEGATYVFAVGMRPAATAATFSVKGLGHAKAEVIGENRSLDVRGGTFTDEFGPYAVHLYRIP